MKTEPSESPVSPNPDAAPPPADGTVPIDWRYWARRLLVCNPFFLASAALLLFGINRLSLDPEFLNDDRSNLLFNYGALQIYESIVVLTALILARRKIWYDSSLLVVVEHGLVFVPFMLIGQGALIGRPLGLLLAAGAATLAGLRARAVRKLFPDFNLPPRALLLGAALLALNAILPVCYPPAVERDTEDWAGPNGWLWLVVLPLLVAGANLLPRPTRYGGGHPQRHWLPLFTFGLWVAGTGVHLWSLAHVSGLPFQSWWLGPAMVTAAWTLHFRLGDCLLTPGTNLQRTVLVLVFLTPLVAFSHSTLFEILTLTNALGFGLLVLQGGAIRCFARDLLLLCLPLAVGGLPEEAGRELLPHFSRARCIIAAFALTLVLSALRRFRLLTGWTGAVGVMVLVAGVYPGASPHAYLQAGLIFLLTHSLAWSMRTKPASWVRALTGSAWILNSMVWVHDYNWRTDVRVSLSALLLLATWFTIWKLDRKRPEPAVACCAAVVSVSGPVDGLLVQGSTGEIALATSAFLFLAGFILAWTRHRWEQTRG